MNLPPLPLTKNTLYLGLGGGYDILGAVPIHEALKSNAVFVSVTKDIRNLGKYDPHYCLDPMAGAAGQAIMLDTLIERHDIDTIIGIDGGVDCLMHGDERHAGTVLQDFISLGSMQLVKRPVNKIVACVGFGCETDENLNHYAVLENIAVLAQKGGFIGSCSLTNDMPEFAEYKRTVDQWSTERKSHIQSRVIAAVEGQFGDIDLGDDPNISQIIFGGEPKPRFINPLMSVYWFFKFEAVVEQNLVLPYLLKPRTTSEALVALRCRSAIIEKKRDKKGIPL